MAQPEARITIDRNPSPPDLTKNRAATKMVEAAAVADQMRARRNQIHEQAKLDTAGAGVGAPTEDREPAPEREDVDSIEIPLRDGRVIEYGPPSGVSLSDRIARLYSTRSFSEGGPDPGITEYRLTRLLMGVRMIDNKPVPPIANLVDRTRIANQLGDEVIDLLTMYDRKYWPPLTEAEIPLIKKNLRQPRL